MSNYKFDGIKGIYVNGDCHGEFKAFFSNLKRNLSINKEDMDETHPMELERIARKKAKEEAAFNARMNTPVGGRRILRNPFGEPRNPYDIGNTFTTTTFTTGASLSEYTEKIFNEAKKSHGFKSVYSNSIIFVAGDCGFGFNKEKYYTDLLEKYNKILSYNNVYVIFVRGNHDDPSYFDGNRINFSNIKAVPDYSIVEAANKTILCVGGAISTDRMWRKEQEKRINRFRPGSPKMLYWENEAPVLDKEKMDEIFKEHSKIDYVVSHTAPSFVDPTEHQGLSEWEGNDKDLRTDVNNERLTMDRIFEYLRDNDRRPIYWAYGHFDICMLNMRSGTWFRALQDGFNPISVESDISLMLAEKTLSKAKLKKKSGLKVKMPERYIQPAIDNDPWQNDELLVNEEVLPEGNLDGEAQEQLPIGEEVADDMDIPGEEEAYNGPDNGVTVEVGEPTNVNVIRNRVEDYAQYQTVYYNGGFGDTQITAERVRLMEEALNRMHQLRDNGTTAAVGTAIGDNTATTHI